MHCDSFEIIDFHSHILPGIDDGSEDVDMSVKMLEMLKNQGVDTVIASPHFYRSDNTIDDFCCRRDKAYNDLVGFIESGNLDLPKIVPAAEVKIYPGLWEEEGLDRLCLPDSKVILLEMPYENWSDWMYHEVYSVCAKGFIPVMAHVERYLKTYASASDIFEKLLSLRVFAQCNSEGMKSFSRRNFVKKVVLSGKLGAIGSDAHNITDRKPDFDIACKFLKKKFGESYFAKLMKRSSVLLGRDAIKLI